MRVSIEMAESLFRERINACRMQSWMVAFVYRESRRKLSDSLLNDPLWVNDPVPTGPQRGFEPLPHLRASYTALQSGAGELGGSA